MPTGSHLEPYDPSKPRLPMMVPAGLRNLAPGSKVTCNDKNVTTENLAKLTDGDKEGGDASIMFLRKGKQWVQLDLGMPERADTKGSLWSKPVAPPLHSTST